MKLSDRIAKFILRRKFVNRYLVTHAVAHLFPLVQRRIQTGSADLGINTSSRVARAITNIYITISGDIRGWLERLL